MPRANRCIVAATTALVAVMLAAAGDADAVTAGGLLPDTLTAPALSPTKSLPELPKLQPDQLLPSLTLPAVPPASVLPSTPAPIGAPSASIGVPATGSVAGQGTGSPADTYNPPSAVGERESAGSGAVWAASLLSTVRSRRQRTARKLRSELTELDGCLSALTPIERRVLILLSGLDRRRAYTRAQVAARLDISRKRVGRIKRRGMRRLRGTARSQGCAAGRSGEASVVNVPLAAKLFSGAGITRPVPLAQTSPFATAGDKHPPFVPPLPERLPVSSSSTAVGSAWLVALIAIAGAFLLAIVGRELRRLR